MEDQTSSLIELTTEIVTAHVSNNRTAATELPGLIQSVFVALSNAQTPAVPDAAPAEPAVSIRSSVKHDYIVCLEDGAKLKMLKRYLRSRYDMTPEDYRAKWGLPRDYPMVAPAYAEQRRTLAHSIGLGRKKTAEVVDVVEPAKPKRKAEAKSDAAPSAPKKRGRPPKAKSADNATATVEAEAAETE